MNKVIIFPTATLLSDAGEVYPGVEELIVNLNREGNKIIVISHDFSKLGDLLDGHHFIEYIKRYDIRSYITDNDEDFYVLVGSSNVDLQVASNKKMLLINPMWAQVQEEKALQYGLEVRTTEGLYKVLKILHNQTAWFYTLNVEDRTKVYSLTRANYKGNIESANEVELIQEFEKVLKYGNKRFFRTLLLHFLGAILKNPEFKTIDIWAIMPSSSTELNDDMWYFKEKARLTMGKRLSAPLFIRHTATAKSRGQGAQQRIPCDRHFDTIMLNPFYAGKLKGKNICVLDDFINNGTSFETMRNLLRNEEVNDIIFVSLGKFERKYGVEYYKQDYELTGDLYDQGYSYAKKNISSINGIYNNQARRDIQALYEIIFS